MLIKDRKLYYSAGELAGLFGIPKQTMFYYVKMGLLVPDYIADNGYRYFGDDQYLHMEIIYFLRKLIFPYRTSRPIFARTTSTSCGNCWPPKGSTVPPSSAINRDS